MHGRERTMTSGRGTGSGERCQGFKWILRRFPSTQNYETSPDLNKGSNPGPNERSNARAKPQANYHAIVKEGPDRCAHGMAPGDQVRAGVMGRAFDPIGAARPAGRRGAAGCHRLDSGIGATGGISGRSRGGRLVMLEALIGAGTAGGSARCHRLAGERSDQWAGGPCRGSRPGRSAEFEAFASF